MPYEKEEDERSENQPTPEVRAEDKLVCTMPYEKEEDERSENQPTHEVRAESKLVWTMPYEKEEDERSDVNWDRFAVRGYEIWLLGQLLYYCLS